MGHGEGAGEGQGEGEGGGKGRGLPPFCNSILWFLILWFLGWPIASFCAWWYILLLPFSVCIDVLKEVCDFLLKVVQLPRTCAEGIVEGRDICR